jgi:alpha-galactosidase
MKHLDFKASKQELQKKREWVRRNFEDDSRPPFSFSYGGIPFETAYKNWEKQITGKSLDAARNELTAVYTEKGGLKVTCTVIEYLDHAAVEWTVYMENCAAHDSAAISDVLGVDAVFFEGSGKERKASGDIELYSFKGDTCAPDGYEPEKRVIDKDTLFTFYPAGGRPTNFQMPYYRLQDDKNGMIFVLSWQGQWEVNFDLTDEGLHIIGGQQRFNAYLLPGEKIRMPMGLVLFYEGCEDIRAINLWRRWFLDHNIPRVNGELIRPFYANYPGRIYCEMEKATEENLKSYADMYLDHDIPFDYLWIDAGWYETKPIISWPLTGTWKVDKNRFPNGLRAVTDYIRRKAGVKTILWFEPERVTKGTELFDEHNEWCLSCARSRAVKGEEPGDLISGGGLLDLGNPDARQWITERLISLIRSEGIDLYRQDFNIDPLDYWTENDMPGRTGIVENHYCTGYLRMWDDILAAFPGIIIDSCSSGGRRNDLETVRRALPLHKTDYNYGDLTSKHGYHHSLFQWFPFFGSFNCPADQKDIYYQRSSILLAYHGCEDVFQPWYDFDKNREWMKEWRETAHCFYGDYIPLTPYSRDEKEWIGWQFDLGNSGEGLVQMFMRPGSTKRKASFPLKNLEENSIYSVKDYNTGLVTDISGGELLTKGLKMTMKKTPDSCLFYYKKLV